VNNRWLGGTLTNFATVQKSIKRLRELKAMKEDGRMAELSKKEAARLERELKHLQANLEGIESMAALPDALFVIDSSSEDIAVREARRMGIPVVAIVDTNCDPDLVDVVIPGNDDALRAIKLFTSKIADAVKEGREQYERSQLESQKAAEPIEGGVAAAPAAETAAFVDASAYEEYEKQEGYFVDRAFETPATDEILAQTEKESKE